MDIRYRLEAAMEVLQAWAHMTGLISPLDLTVRILKLQRERYLLTRYQPTEAVANLHTTMGASQFAHQQESWILTGSSVNFRAYTPPKSTKRKTPTLWLPFRQFDMPVLFGRDLSRFSEFISVWYGDSPMLRTPSKVDPPPKPFYTYLVLLVASQYSLPLRLSSDSECSTVSSHRQVCWRPRIGLASQ